MKNEYKHKADTSDPQSINETLGNLSDISRTYDGKYPGNATVNDTFSVNRLVSHPINTVYIYIYIPSRNFGSSDAISAFRNHVLREFTLIVTLFL